MKAINLKHSAGTTKILVSKGISKRISAFVNPGSKFVIITNRKINRLYRAKFLDRLTKNAGCVGKLMIPDSETAKDIETAKSLYEKMISAKLDRSSTVIAVGGGVCTDLSGFVASTFMRGIKWIAVPTTLIGQVDASIGGKTAVNLKSGKNLVGSFWQPEKVLVDPELLTTLPKSQLISGLGEVIKYGMIASNRIFSECEQHSRKVAEKRPVLAEETIVRCIRIKTGIVALDERDTGKRHILNFGHTLGHALETSKEYKGISHGKAVAIGMLFAAKIANDLGILAEKDYNRLHMVLFKVGLVNKRIELEKNVLLKSMAADKKRRGKSIKMVLPERIGKVTLKEMAIDTLDKDALWRLYI